MDFVKGLSREVQVVLGGGVLLLIVSFFDWQQVSLLGFTVGVDEWHGIGIVAGLLTVALLVWEIARLMGANLPVGSMSEGLVSVALALFVGLFTLVTFATHGTARHWPAWVGLVLAIVIVVAAVARARAEGVEMPQASRGSSG